MSADLSVDFSDPCRLPELKAQVSFSDRNLSVVCHCCKLSLFCFDNNEIAKIHGLNLIKVVNSSNTR